MNKVLFFILLAFQISLLPLGAIASNDEDALYSYLEEIPGDDVINDDKYGERRPARRYVCEISMTDGVSIQGYAGEIESYEIWKSDEECIAVFSDEISFVEYLFSLEGEYGIRLRFSDSVLARVINHR